MIDFIIQSLENKYYIYFNVNPKHIAAYTLRYDWDVHDLFIYGYSLEKKVFYIADCFEYGKYAYATCTFDEVRNGLLNLQHKDENYITLNACIELLSLVSEKEKLADFDFLRVRDTLVDYVNGRPTTCCNVQDYKWEYGKSFQTFGVECYKYIHERVGLLNEFVALSDYHIIWEHKKHLEETVKYMIEAKYFYDEEQRIQEKLVDLTKKTLIGRNMVIKYDVTKQHSIQKKLHILYDEIANQEYDLLQELLTKLF